MRAAVSKRATLFSATAALVALVTLVSVDNVASQSTRPRSNRLPAAAAKNKTCDKRQLDTSTAVLFVFGQRGVYLPKNQDEMVPHCSEEFEAEDFIKNYARKCAAPFERQLIGMLMLGAGQVLRKRCGPEGTKEYLSHYTCIKKSINEMHDLMDQLIYTLMQTNELEVDKRIPVSCCAFARFMDLSNRVVRRECESFDRGAEEYVGTKMIRGYVGDVLDLSCQGYDGNSPKCTKLKLPDGGYEWRNNTLNRIQTARLPPNKPNSVVLPFLSIFSNL